jgi:hypothetical protein
MEKLGRYRRQDHAITKGASELVKI